MAKMMKDGWHIVCGYEVYVEDNRIRRGVKKDYNGSLVPAWPYRWLDEYNCWTEECGCTVSAFRSGFYRGTYDMK